MCGRCALLEDAELNPANYKAHTEAGNRDDLPPLTPWSPPFRQGAVWPRPHWGERKRGLPRSLPSSPLPGRWVGPCLTPPPSRCWVEAALQRSKDAQRVKRCAPQEWEGLDSHRVRGWSQQEEAWRYCLLSPCICLRYRVNPSVSESVRHRVHSNSVSPVQVSQCSSLPGAGRSCSYDAALPQPESHDHQLSLPLSSPPASAASQHPTHQISPLGWGVHLRSESQSAAIDGERS